MRIEGLPRSIVGDDETMHNIKNIVFQDFVIENFTIQNPKAVKVEFEKNIKKHNPFKKMAFKHFVKHLPDNH